MIKDEVGVVIRTKNRNYFLLRALNTVIEQDYTNYKIVIVNDGGDKEKFEEIFEFSEFTELISNNKILLVSNEESVGRGKAFNIGVECLQSSKYIACLDDDDTWTSNFLSEMVAKLQSESFEKVKGVICHCDEVIERITKNDSAKNSFDTSRLVKLKSYQVESYNIHDYYVNPLYYYSSRHNFYPVQALFYRDVILEFGGFSEEVPVIEDRSFYMKYISQYAISIIPKKLAFHHMREVDASIAPDEKNTIGDNKTYDWHKLFTKIEVEKFYETDQSKQLVVNHYQSQELRWIEGVNFSTIKHMVSNPKFILKTKRLKWIILIALLMYSLPFFMLLYITFK